MFMFIQNSAVVNIVYSFPARSEIQIIVACLEVQSRLQGRIISEKNKRTMRETARESL